MSKKFKAAMAGLAFVAGCEIGIALQLMKMIRDYTVKEKAANEPLEDALLKLNLLLTWKALQLPQRSLYKHKRRNEYGLQDYCRFKLRYI